jgi:excinuclease ABC subunit B
MEGAAVLAQLLLFVHDAPMFNSKLHLESAYKPAGDQPQAVDALVKSLTAGNRHQTLLGVTGSGKTFTVANVIEKIQQPTLVIAHNKTLAAQLAQEYREFFPHNAVHYFVSYYDYYQPEAYIPHSDTYIEKDAQINEEIDRLRHASTQALLTRRDVIIVATVSCIYGLGSPVEYEKVHFRMQVGQKIDRSEFIRRLIDLHFERTTADLEPGMFRALGNNVEIMPVNEKMIYRVALSDSPEGSVIEAMDLIDPITRRIVEQTNSYFLFPAKHFITAGDQVERALRDIEHELQEQLKTLEEEKKILEADRLRRRTKYDLAMIREIGYCNGIENYSRHFSGKAPGEPPDTLLSYFPKKNGKADFLTVIDESHVTVPQLNGMYAGDASRKKTLIEHGFRLPSAADNRPLKFDEFMERVGQLVYVSATPGPYEKKQSTVVAEQIIRPTGLVDPELIVRPVTGKKGSAYEGQVIDFIAETEKTVANGERVIATTLTKKMAEDLSQYLKEKNVKAEYIHSEVKTIERIQILTDFRRGKFDVLVGVNLLREGLDLPEVSFIGILDADKEGFLRSETSLIQTIGRAARNVNGRVVLYADQLTGSLERAISETNRRREIQLAYNKKHGITPKTIIKKISDITDQIQTNHDKTVAEMIKLDTQKFIKDPEGLLREKEEQMNEAVKILDFESAAILRDEIMALKDKIADLPRKKEKPLKRGFKKIE